MVTVAVTGVGGLLGRKVAAELEASGEVDRIVGLDIAQPAGLHGFVYPCAADEICALGAPYDYLRTLLRNPDPAVPVDDLLVAALGQIYTAHDGGPDGQAALIEAGRALSRLLNDDHERLQSILRRAV